MDIATLRDASRLTEHWVERVTPDQDALPTPCTEWNVHELLNHMLGALMLGKAILTDTEPEVAVGPGALPATDLVGDDALKAYRVRVEALLGAAQPDALARVVTTPLGDMPGNTFLGFTTLDIAVHGWDLAKATQQDTTMPDDLAEQLLDFAQMTLKEGSREPFIAPTVPVPEDGRATERLVAYLGRMP